MKIINIEGIGPAYANKLNDESIRTTDALLKMASTRRGRSELADRTGIPEKLILEWVNRADLMRVPGVGEACSSMLHQR